jgi:hypothetical protein
MQGKEGRVMLSFENNKEWIDEDVCGRWWIVWSV